MIPKPYSTGVTITQAIIVLAAIAAILAATLTGHVGGDALVAILSAVLGAAFGAGSVIAGSNGVATAIHKAAQEATTASQPPSTE